MMCHLGLKDDGKNNFEKLSFQHVCVNNKHRKEIDYFKSPHTFDIQRSKYIQIDNDIEDERKFQQQEEFSSVKTTRSNRSRVDISKVANSTHLKFRKPTEVNLERSKFALFKGTFAQKINNIKCSGEKIIIIQKIESWIE